MRLYSFIVANVTALCRERRRYVTEEVVIESFLFSKKLFLLCYFVNGRYLVRWGDYLKIKWPYFIEFCIKGDVNSTYGLSLYL